MTTGKTIALTIETFVGRVMSLFFSILYRFVMRWLDGITNPMEEFSQTLELDSPSAEAGPAAY